MHCPKCDSENVNNTEKGTIGLVRCPDCGYSRAHRLPGLYLEVLLDWAEYKNLSIDKDMNPTSVEEIAKCQQQTLSKK